MIRRPPRSTPLYSSAASDVYKRQGLSPSIAQGASFRRIGRGEPVLFDFVPVRDGYMADFTRTYSVGALGAELLRATTRPCACRRRLRGRPGRAWPAAPSGG